MSTGRNDPCPCGSGRKYKHCCLREQQAQRAVPADRGVGVAMAWIQQHFRRQVPEVIEDGFFEGIDPETVADALGALDDDRVQLVNAMIGDYLLSDAIFERGDDEGRGIDWVLDRAPRLSDEQRVFLGTLADAPLRLYEVVAARPGEGLELRDALDDARSPPFVTERLASTTLEPGDMIGVRVLRWPDHAELGGVVYTLDRGTAADVMERVRRQMEGDFDDDDAADFAAADRPTDPDVAELIDAEFAREYAAEEEAEDAAAAAQIEDEAVADAIRGAWLLNLVFPQAPQIVDRVSGAPMMLIEDDYHVSDAGALARALAACADVSGSPEHGWSRADDPQAEFVRPLTTINPTDSPNRVTLFHRTEAGAEAGREWFERVAGDIVRRGERRTTDPGELLRSRGNAPPSAVRAHEEFHLPPGVDPSAVFEQVIHHTYANWCDEPIGALDDRTPRECLVDTRGRERVRYLLRTYEHGERKQAAAQNRTPVSYDFLWRALGLAREE